MKTRPPAAFGLFFPHFVDSGGWTTQFILFSGAPAQTASGVIRFTGQDGQPLGLSRGPDGASNDSVKERLRRDAVRQEPQHETNQEIGKDAEYVDVLPG